jgi:hypothetical protein
MSTPPSRAAAALLNDRGCLTEAGLEVLRSSAAGQAPAELAVHLAGCARCQERVLAVDAPNPRRRRRTARPEFPSLGRSLLLAALVVAAIVAALATLRQLVPQ